MNQGEGQIVSRQDPSFTGWYLLKGIFDPLVKSCYKVILSDVLYVKVSLERYQVVFYDHLCGTAPDPHCGSV